MSISPTAIFDVGQPVWLYLKDVRLWWPSYVGGMDDSGITVLFYDEPTYL